MNPLETIIREEIRAESQVFTELCSAWTQTGIRARTDASQSANFVLLSAWRAVQTAPSVMAGLVPGLVPAIHAAPFPANPKLFRRLDDVAECACIRLR